MSRPATDSTRTGTALPPRAPAGGRAGRSPRVRTAVASVLLCLAAAGPAVAEPVPTGPAATGGVTEPATKEPATKEPTPTGSGTTGPAATARPEDPPPHATERWDRVAAALREDPLFVDTDLADVFPGPVRAALRAEMRQAEDALQAPVYFIALPNPRESEAKGSGELVLDGVHARLGEDGLYLMVDHRGRLAGDAYGVPRDFGYELVDWEIGDAEDWDAPMADLVGRVSTVLDKAVAAPYGEPSTEDGTVTPPSFVEEETASSAREPAIFGPFFAGLLILGPLLALLLWGLWAAVRALPSLAGAARQPARPGLRRLRALARRELRALAERLENAGDTRGAAAALRAYDAASLVADEAHRSTDSAEEALDLVGVVVLSRQGGAALAEDLPHGPAFCAVNPLHGRAAGTRSAGGPYPPGAVCAACAPLSRAEIARRVLRVPDGRRYPEVEGRWRQGFTGRPDLAARVLESLGVV